jgi:hypothetical protein
MERKKLSFGAERIRIPFQDDDFLLDKFFLGPPPSAEDLSNDARSSKSLEKRAVSVFAARVHIKGSSNP